MKLYVIAVGNKMPDWVNAGFDEYARRMPRQARIHLVEIKPEKRGEGKSLTQILAAEGKRIAAAIPRDCERMMLDERGEKITTTRLARIIMERMQNGRDVAFVIGGADGLDPDFKRSATRLLALSALTLPHGLTRVLLAEQLYRALTMIKGHPYHRE